MIDGAGTGRAFPLGRRLAVAAFVALGVVAPVRAADLEELKREAQDLIQRLDTELEAVKREREALRKEREELERQRKAAETKPAAPVVAAPVPPGAPVEAPAETARKVDILTQEIEQLKSNISLPPTKELKSVYGLGPAASKVYQVSRGLSIGGYGEGFLNEAVSDTKGATDRADALRFVLYTGYKFSDRIILNSEIEFEHGTTASTVSSSSGSVSVEFAYLDFLGWDYLNARAGLVLVPLGFINEQHEPVYFHGNNRPEVERQIIPTTWRELGVGVFGSPHPDVQYRGYFHTSLDARGFTSSGIRGGRQNGNRALAENWAGSARVDYTPSQVPGFLIGGSAFLGETGQNNEFDGRTDVDGVLAVTDFHAQYRYRGLELRALYAWSTLGDAKPISIQNESTVADREYGWYGEIAYDLLPLFFADTRQYLAPFFRYENFDTQESMPAGIPRDATKDTDLQTYGITYKPHPQVALKLDYRNFELAESNRADDVNIGLGFVF
jgi:hypothetical protein